MWFKNTLTGHIWEILDETIQAELKNKPHFEEVESPIESKTSKQNNDKKSFECDICKKVLKNEKALNGHIRMAHKDGDK